MEVRILFIEFCNWYFSMLHNIPERWIDLVIIVTFFAVSMILSSMICGLGYFIVTKLNTTNQGG